MSIEDVVNIIDQVLKPRIKDFNILNCDIQVVEDELEDAWSEFLILYYAIKEGNVEAFETKIKLNDEEYDAYIIHTWEDLSHVYYIITLAKLIIVLYKY